MPLLFRSVKMKSIFFMMKSFLPWQMKVCIHTKMVNTSGAAVLPKKTLLFLSRRHLFHFGKLNASSVQISENEIVFFFVMKSFLPWQMKVCIYTIMVNTSGAAVLPKKIFLFVPRRHLFRFGKLKTILSPPQDLEKRNDSDFKYQCLTISNVCYGLKKTGWSL